QDRASPFLIINASDVEDVARKGGISATGEIVRERLAGFRAEAAGHGDAVRGHADVAVGGERGMILLQLLFSGRRRPRREAKGQDAGEAHAKGGFFCDHGKALSSVVQPFEGTSASISMERTSARGSCSACAGSSTTSVARSVRASRFRCRMAGLCGLPVAAK